MVASPNNLRIIRKDNVADVITTFLNRHKHDSKDTAKCYKTDIVQFFQIMTGKELSILTEDDLHFKLADLEEYQLTLAETNYSNTSVNRKINSIRSLFRYLKANGFKIDLSGFEAVKALDDDTEHYGTFNLDEIGKMVDFALTEEKGEDKALLIQVAFLTSFRQKELLTLTWDKIQKIDGVWVVSVKAKGNKWCHMPIPDDLYDNLCALRDSNGDKYNIIDSNGNIYIDNKVFHLQTKTVVSMMQRYIKKLNLDPENNRKLCFHSIKKAGIREVYIITNGDILAVAQQGHHSSFATTLKYYLELQRDYSKMANLKIGQQADLSVLDNLSQEDFIRIIHKCSRETQFEIINKINGVKKMELNTVQIR